MQHKPRRSFAEITRQRKLEHQKIRGGGSKIHTVPEKDWKLPLNAEQLKILYLASPFRNK